MGTLRRLALVTVISFSLARADCLAAGPVLVFDPMTEIAISEAQSGELWYPASLTKLMTAYLVFQKLKDGGLTLDQNISMTERARWQPPSRTELEPGTAITVDVALQAMLVYSANDMAFALAEAVSGTAQSFVIQMNGKAHELGLSSTHFTNPNGIFDIRQVTTARDMGILASALLREFPQYAHYYSQSSVTVGKRTLTNRNLFLKLMPGADGMKTGYVCNSGFNLVATATVDGRKLAAIVFGASNAKLRAERAKELLDKAYAAKQPTGSVKLSDIETITLGTSVPKDLTATLCPRKRSPEVISSRQLSGWGISFGTYSSVEKAGMALRGRVLDTAGIDLPGEAGVIRLPGNSGYAAMLWLLDEQQSRSSCALYLQRAAPCSVISPQEFATLAKLTPDPPPKPKPRPVGQKG